MKRFKINEILKQGTFFEKIDFINNYDLSNKPDDRNFIVSYVKQESLSTKNEWYRITLIDFASKLGIADNMLLNNYLKFLNKGNSYYLKLTVMDYINDSYKLYDNEEINYSPVTSLLNNKYDRIIVKIEACLTLILLYQEKKIVYLSKIRELLRNAEDYRAHIRLYNFIINDYTNIPDIYINDFIEITKKKSFATARAITSTLAELDNVRGSYLE